MAQEKNFENKVKQFLKDENCYYIKYWGGAAYTQKGVPDLLVCCNGFFIGIELKSEVGKPSELQKYNIQKIKDAGGLAMVLYPKDFEDFKKTIKFLKDYGVPAKVDK